MILIKTMLAADAVSVLSLSIGENIKLPPGTLNNGYQCTCTKAVHAYK